jgi:hypothetical protein
MSWTDNPIKADKDKPHWEKEVYAICRTIKYICFWVGEQSINQVFHTLQ